MPSLGDKLVINQDLVLKKKGLEDAEIMIPVAVEISPSRCERMMEPFFFISLVMNRAVHSRGCVSEDDPLLEVGSNSNFLGVSINTFPKV